jgi:hypothetical protein
MKLKTFAPALFAATMSCQGSQNKDSQEPSPVGQPLPVISLSSEGSLRIPMGTPFNSLSNEPSSTLSKDSEVGCVITTEIGTIGDIVNGLESYQTSVVKSQDELFLHLELDKKGKLDALSAIAESRGSQQADAISSISINKNYSYVLLSAKKKWQPLQIKKASINPDALTLVKDNPRKFFSRCGDKYVGALGLVTEAYGLMECRSETQEAKREMDLIIEEAAGITGANSMGKSFQDTVDQIGSKTKDSCRLFVWQRGGKGAVSNDAESVGISITNYIAGAGFDDAAMSNVGAVGYKNSVVSAEFWSLVQDLDLDFNSARSQIKLWQQDIDQGSDKLGILLDAADDEKDDLKKNAIYDQAQKVVETVKAVEGSIKRCAENPSSPEACRDPRKSN